MRWTGVEYWPHICLFTALAILKQIDISLLKTDLETRSWLFTSSLSAVNILLSLITALVHLVVNIYCYIYYTVLVRSIRTELIFQDLS